MGVGTAPPAIRMARTSAALKRRNGWRAPALGSPRSTARRPRARQSRSVRASTAACQPRPHSACVHGRVHWHGGKVAAGRASTSQLVSSQLVARVSWSGIDESAGQRLRRGHRFGRRNLGPTDRHSAGLSGCRAHEIRLFAKLDEINCDQSVSPLGLAKERQLRESWRARGRAS
jgi:hypothetical protein